MNIRYPIVYNVFSPLLGKPYTVVVVRNPGEYYEYSALCDEHPFASWTNYNERGQHAYDDPKSGIFQLPISPRNELRTETEVIEGASDTQINALLEALKSVTRQEVCEALAKARRND